jgi:hypothetical protein
LRIEFPFIIGNPFSRARLVEAIVHKGPQLAEIEMILQAQAPEKGGVRPRADEEHVHGAERARGKWRLTQPVASVAFATKPGETHRMTLTLKIPKSLHHPLATITIFQRNDHRSITGSVQLEVRHAHHKPSTAAS